MKSEQLALPLSFGYVVPCIPGLPHGGHVWISNAPEAVCQCGKERYDGEKP